MEADLGYVIFVSLKASTKGSLFCIYLLFINYEKTKVTEIMG